MNRLDRSFLKIYRDDSVRSQDGKCAYCRTTFSEQSPTIEHRQPKSTGGLNRKDNILASCKPCNKAKGVMDESKFKKIISGTFPYNVPFEIQLIWSTRRLNMRVEKSIKNIQFACYGKDGPKYPIIQIKKRKK